MLPKKFRITVVLFNNNPNPGFKLSTPLFTVFIKKSTFTIPRFVFVISKKIDKRSSSRHQTKRLFVEVVRRYLTSFKKPADVLIKAKKIIQKKDRMLIEKEFDKLFKGEGLI